MSEADGHLQERTSQLPALFCIRKLRSQRFNRSSPHTFDTRNSKQNNLKQYFTMKFVAVATSMLVTAQGFVVNTPGRQNFVQKAIIDDEVDFDAPTERAMQVGNIVQSKNLISVGPFKDIEVPEFLMKAFNKVDPSVDIDHLAIDEECYLGKNGDLDECADFDP